MNPELAAAMLDWYAEMGRDLPWRRTRDPYEILVSEIMLQQTRVETVLGRYESFLERFPTIESLAATDVQDVLAEWSGLGYYRRARGLHALARAVVDEHRGEIPADLDKLRALPGLGPYTAAAIGSIAFGIRALSVDGNVGRILCRIAAIEEDPKRAPVRRRLEAMVASAMQAHPPGELNQAIMELGARVCTPRSPGCDHCPCAGYCEAHASGIEELIPATARRAVNAVKECATVIQRGGRYLLFRGQRPSLVQDMWEFPTLDSRLGPTAGSACKQEPETDARRSSTTDLRHYLRDLGWEVELGPELGEIHHGMTNRRISCRVYEGRLENRSTSPSRRSVEGSADPSDPVVEEPHPDLPPAPDFGWFSPEEATRLPLAASARKTLSELLDEALD